MFSHNVAVAAVNHTMTIWIPGANDCEMASVSNLLVKCLESLLPNISPYKSTYKSCSSKDTREYQGSFATSDVDSS